jgi:ornithine decarboxylase
MSNSSPRGAVALSAYFQNVVQTLRPDIPVHISWPTRARDAANAFTSAFPGRTLYAVKCNTDERILNALHDGGVQAFDAASINEVRLIKKLFPNAPVYFMAPVKSRSAIREAYTDHGVRAFVLDGADELEKIKQETGGARDLELFIRLALPKSDTAIDFSSKFGAPAITAIDLLRRAEKSSAKLGVSFHVGTHCVDPAAYRRAIDIAASVIKSSGVSVQSLDIGGGFPAGMGENDIPPLEKFLSAIKQSIRSNGLSHMELLAEPGRALVYSSGSLIVRVESRRDNLLFINDGIYGGLQEASEQIGMTYPAHVIRENGKLSSLTAAFNLTGPTCDSLDVMPGPFELPRDIAEGDYIAFDLTGAYGEETRTRFNGFTDVHRVIEHRIPCVSSVPQRKVA